MRLFLLLPLLFLVNVLSAQSAADEETMARVARELAAKLNGKKLRKVAILRLSFQEDPGTAEGAWFADELAFALQSTNTDFAIISRAEMEQRAEEYAARKSGAPAASESGYEETEYAEESYEEYEESYEEEGYEEEGYEEESYEEETATKSYQSEKTETANKKKKNTGLLIGGALLAAGAAALLAGDKKPMAGVRASIGGTIVEQGNQLVVTFRAVDRKGRVLAMARGRFARLE